MNYIVEDRIENMLYNDKIIDPQRMCEILKNELEPVVRNYLQFKGDMKVRFKKENSKNIFWFEIETERIKPFGYISY